MVWKSWRQGPDLEPGVVDVWRVPLDGDPETVERGWAVLSREERERAGKFRFEKDRRRFVLSHRALRELLAPRVGTVNFRYEDRGKPYVEGRRVEFNLAHSGDMALVGMTAGTEVGVDIEQHRPIESGVAERFFSPYEIAALHGLSGDSWNEAFFRCWTRKEAFLKANGAGLAFGLDAFSVSLDEKPSVLEVAGSEREAGKWALADVAPGESYSGAVAVCFPLRGVRCWQFD